ncbi:MAG: glycosyltransferase family 9 protein [Bacteroidota bacterium]|nr:glycosyltransferase family 9 protein [Bacteroidota bacterium]
MKILVLRFSSIGDIILTSPVLRCLKQQLADAEIHFATKRIFNDLIAHSPYVDKVHLLDEALDPLIKELKKEKFDLIVDLHNNLRTARIKRKLRADARSFPILNIEKWLLVNLKKDRLPHIHIVDRYLSTVAHLGVKNDQQGLELFIPADREIDLRRLPPLFASGYTALAIGAAHETKRLPLHRLIELGQKIDGPIVIIGGEEDVADGRAIASAIGSRAYDATGRYDILGSASLIRQANGVIAHDSGAMHIASAFRKNVESIWGNTDPEFGLGPYIPLHPERAHVAEVLGLPCRPCSKIGFDKCPQGHFRCMEDQDMDAIAARVHGVQ